MVKLKNIGFKCFTLFSSLVNYWNKLRAKFKNIKILIRHDPHWYPLTDNDIDVYYVAIHSLNIIPSMEDFREIEPGSFNTMKFSFVKSKLINNRIIKMCHHYGVDYEYSTRRECIIMCLLDKLKMNLRDIWKILPDELVRLEFYQNNIIDDIGNATSLKITSDQEDYQDHVEECKDNCKPECKQFFYIYDHIVESRRNENDLFARLTNIKINHNRVPDVIVRHMPEFTLNSFIGNFGGLLGMWLGLSVSSLGTGLSS